MKTALAAIILATLTTIANAQPTQRPIPHPNPGPAPRQQFIRIVPRTPGPAIRPVVGVSATNGKAAVTFSWSVK